MTEMVKTNDNNYVYDKESGALLNSNNEELEMYNFKRKKALEFKELVDRVTFLEQRVRVLEKESIEVNG